MNEMECDEDQGIGDSNKSLNTIDAIAKEARTVYNQLKMLLFTLKGNHDGDSGKFNYLFMCLERLKKMKKKLTFERNKKNMNKCF